MSLLSDIVRPLELADGSTVDIVSLAALEAKGIGHPSRLPRCLLPILESLVRREAHPAFTAAHVRAFASWTPAAAPEEFPFLPARVLLQDFTGVPCIVDLAALRDAMARAGADPARIEPSIPVDLVIDHSVQVDECASPDALGVNLRMEMQRNRERYGFLRWGQSAFKTLSVMPPGLGICHQVNMELLGACVLREPGRERDLAYFDSVVGTDSHTPMINSMGIAGWGVGGIEAEAAMLGQPIPLLTPTVTGVRLSGAPRPGVTPTDIALCVVQLLRTRGVVGHFVEYFGPGLDALTLADRAPMANMTPEYGATMGFFPVDAATLEYLRMTGRSEARVDLVERYARAQGMFRDGAETDRAYSHVVDLDLADVEPAVAGPRRPHNRVTLDRLHTTFLKKLSEPVENDGFGITGDALESSVDLPGKGLLEHGSVVIAAITSCTNTSNPSLLLGAGILAAKAVKRGLKVPGFVKTSFAPGSRVAEHYLRSSGLLKSLEALGFHIAAYGCTTCIGNSGPLADDVSTAIRDGRLVAAAVLSGNRNFEGRIHPETQADFLASPPLVVAYALKGTVTGDIVNDPIAFDASGDPVYLADLWPTAEDVRAHLDTANDPDLYARCYADAAGLNPEWDALPDGGGATFDWDPASTYVRTPPWLDGTERPPAPPADIVAAHVLALLGDFVTTDHISPAGTIDPDGPAAHYLRGQGVPPEDFNSFGARRGNHEVMARGTFANIRLRNRLVERSGGYTLHHPTGEQVTIFEAAGRYREAGTPLIVVAGKLYGAGSSRDWAAKGPALLGVRAVIAESYERIHRSNLVGMGILPLEFVDGATAASLGLTGKERFTIGGIAAMTPGCRLRVRAEGAGGTVAFDVLSRIDSPVELDYYRHGGVLRYVLRKAAGVA